MAYMTKRQLRRGLMKAQFGRCWLCLIPDWKASTTLHIHRVKPGREGGEYREGNCVLVCLKCHNKCANWTWAEIKTGHRRAVELNMQVMRHVVFEELINPFQGYFK